MRNSLALLVLALGACSSPAKLPPLPTPGPDMCDAYSSFDYGRQAALVESIDTLRKHNANELTFYDKCVAGRQSLKPGGAR